MSDELGIQLSLFTPSRSSDVLICEPGLCKTAIVEGMLQATTFMASFGTLDGSVVMLHTWCAQRRRSHVESRAR